MAVWVQQRCLGFDCFVDSITCIHFAVLPDDQDRRREALYVGCNNGRVLVADVSMMAQQQQQQQQPPSSSSSSSSIRTDVSPFLSLLYTHGSSKSSAASSSSARQRLASAAADDDESRTVFNIARFESLVATCGDDGRCIVSLADRHPPFVRRLRSDLGRRLDQMPSLPEECCLLGDTTAIVGVIDLNKIPIRAVVVFGGRKQWASIDSEAAAAYVALGAEDGMLRVFRINVEKASQAMQRQEQRLKEWSQYCEVLQGSCDIVWVVNTSSSASIPGELSSAEGGSRGAAICSIALDGADDDSDGDGPLLILVGTQTSCSLCECLPEVAGRCGKEADGKPATVDSWLNASVWALSSSRFTTAQQKAEGDHKQKGAAAVAAATTTTTTSSSSVCDSFDSMQVELPLRAMKPKYLGAFHSSRSLGTVMDVAASSDNNSTTAAAAAVTLQVMFPSLGNKQIALPQAALRRVQRPTLFLATSGGAYFAVQPVPASSYTVTKKNNSSNKLTTSCRTYLIAGAAVSGEVCLVSADLSPSVAREEQVTVLCRFSAGRDLIKNITVVPAAQSHSSGRFLLVMCSSYDGTISDWVLAAHEDGGHTGGSSEKVIALRRGVTLVSSSSSSSSLSRAAMDTEAQRMIQSRRAYPLLLRRLRLDPRTQRYVSRSLRPKEARRKGEDSDDEELRLKKEEEDEEKSAAAAALHGDDDDDEATRSTGVAATFLFAEAGVLFASCLFERAVQSFMLVSSQGCEPPRGFYFNGRKTVRVDLSEARSVAEVPEELFQ